MAGDENTFVSRTEMAAALKANDKLHQDRAEAREFVRPYVGELPMALDSAEKIYRSAAEIMGIDDAKGIHASALKTVIKTVGDASRGSQDRMDDFAHDSRGGDGGKSFAERFGTSRITVMPG